jgi:nitrogen fixation NifU-like protein
MDHFRNPRNVGDMPDADGIGHVGNAVCGDIMELYIKVRDNVIVDAKFKTFGCGAAVATSSMVTELVKGKTVDEALKVSNRAVAEALGGLPPIKMHCSLLAEQALKSAITDYYKKHPKV